MTKNITIHELAESLGEEYIVASSLMKLLVRIGAAKEVGKRPAASGGRGKPSVVYEVPNVVELIFWDEKEADKSAEPEVNQDEENQENTEENKESVVQAA